MLICMLTMLTSVLMMLIMVNQLSNTLAYFSSVLKLYGSGGTVRASGLSTPNVFCSRLQNTVEGIN